MAPAPANQEEQTLAALAFLRKVRIRFLSKPCVYEGLRAVLAEYGKYTNAPTSPVVDCAAELLHDQPDLIADFNAFVPSEYKIELHADCHPSAAKPRGKRDERQRRPAVAAGSARARDVSLLEAQRFLERVKTDDAELYDSVVVNLFYVHEERWMDAHQVYAQLEKVFAPGRRDLLRSFAEFLPKGPPPHVVEDKEPDADPRPSSKRKRTAATYAFETSAVKPIRTTKPRSADLLPISLPALDDGEDVKPSRPKKPRNASIKIGQPALDDDGAEDDPCWLVTTQDPHVAAVTFRKMLEFHVRYSNLVATIKRAEELERTRHPQGAFEDLFPGRECQEILDELYDDGWRTMQVALEDGKCVDVAFATILRRLRAEEDLAVELVRSRRDRARYSARKGKGAPAAAVIRTRVVRARWREP